MSCEHLLHVEGLIVTLIWRTAIKALFLCFGFCQVRVGIFCYEYIHHIPSFLLHTHGKNPKPPPFFQKKKGEEGLCLSCFLSVPPSLFQRRYIILVYHRGLCLQLLISVCGFQWNFTGLLLKMTRFAGPHPLQTIYAYFFICRETCINHLIYRYCCYPLWRSWFLYIT